MKPAPDIHPLQIRSLNESFYRADPAEYIVQRIWSLAASLDPATQPRRVQFGEFSMARDQDDIPDVEKVMACGFDRRVAVFCDRSVSDHATRWLSRIP